MCRHVHVCIRVCMCVSVRASLRIPCLYSILTTHALWRKAGLKRALSYRHPILQPPCSLCSDVRRGSETNHFTAAQLFLGDGSQPWSHLERIVCHCGVIEEKHLAPVGSLGDSCLHLNGVIWLNMALDQPRSGLCCLGMLHLLCAHRGLGTEGSKDQLAALTGAPNARGPQRPPCRVCGGHSSRGSTVG